jgi:hypothetical protein
MKIGTLLAIALVLSAHSRPVAFYHYHALARHHVAATRHHGASQSQYVQNFRNEILTH